MCDTRTAEGDATISVMSVRTPTSKEEEVRGEEEEEAREQVDDENHEEKIHEMERQCAVRHERRQEGGHEAVSFLF